MGYIYKITNILTKKCYIGETKKENPLLRWNEHKRKIEKGIGCPALQDAVRKYGIDNFRFDVLIICFDEDRYKFEREYIQKYNSISPNGYNLTKGGEGGGFHGKKHTPETIRKIIQTSRQKYIDNPELRKQMSDRQKIVMNTAEVRAKIKLGINNSEKWKNSKKGNTNNRKHTEDSKNKIRESVLKYYGNDNENKIINKEKHRKIMAESKGIKVQQFDTNNSLMNTFISVSEASRQTGISKASIQNGINDSNKMRCGFFWKKIE